MTFTVTLTLRSRSQKLNKDTNRGQGHIFPKYEDNRSSGYGEVHGYTDTQSRLQQHNIDGIDPKLFLIMIYTMSLQTGHLIARDL